MLRQWLGVVVCLGVVAPAWAGVSGVYDANNVLLGEYAESNTVIHSIQGYRFSLDASTGSIRLPGIAAAITDIGGVAYQISIGLYYSDSNCTGQAYIDVDSTGQHAGGVVVNAGSRGLYYVTKPTDATPVAMGAEFDGQNCNAIVPSVLPVVPVFANDPAVTGVPNMPFAMPIHLEVVPLSQFLHIIFRNGFESSFQSELYTEAWKGGRNCVAGAAVGARAARATA